MRSLILLVMCRDLQDFEAQAELLKHIGELSSAHSLCWDLSRDPQLDAGVVHLDADDGSLSLRVRCTALAQRLLRKVRDDDGPARETMGLGPRNEPTRPYG